MLHEIFTRWLVTLHKIILAHHDEACDCDCSFCVSCGDCETLSIGKFIRMILCPPSLRFHGSSTPLFDWDCIEDKWVCILRMALQYCIVLNYLPLSFPSFQLSYVSLQQIGKCLWVWGISLVVWRRGSGVLDVWASWLNRTVCYQCCHWLHDARWLNRMFSLFWLQMSIGKKYLSPPPFIFLQGFQLIQKEIIIGSRENLQSVCFVKKSSTLCLVFSCIIKLILLNGMGRKYYSQWSMRFLVSFVLTLTFRKTILISIRFWTLIRSPSNHFLYLSSIFASQLIYCFVLLTAQTV